MQKWKIAHIGATIACRNHFLPCPLQHLRLEASRTLRPWLACVKVCDEQLHQHHDCLVERSATARGVLSCAGDSQSITPGARQGEEAARPQPTCMTCSLTCGTANPHGPNLQTQQARTNRTSVARKTT